MAEDAVMQDEDAVLRERSSLASIYGKKKGLVVRMSSSLSDLTRRLFRGTSHCETSAISLRRLSLDGNVRERSGKAELPEKKL